MAKQKKGKGKENQGNKRSAADMGAGQPEAQPVQKKAKGRNKQQRSLRQAEYLQQAAAREGSTMDPFAVGTITPPMSPESESFTLPPALGQPDAPGSVSAEHNAGTAAKPSLKKLTVLDLAKRDSETARLLTARHVPISDADFRPIDKDARRKEFETEAAGWEAASSAEPCVAGLIAKEMLRLVIGDAVVDE